MTDLIVCCDGTWSTLEHTDQGLPTPTNVAKLYNATIKEQPPARVLPPGRGTSGGLLDHLGAAVSVSGWTATS